MKSIMLQLKRGMTVYEKISVFMSDPPVQLTIKMNGLRLLCDYNRPDLYEEYCDAIREKRFAVWSEGKIKETGKRRKMNMEEAKTIFAYFKELATAKQVIIMTEKRSETWLKCCNEISESHSRLDMHRFERMLENNINALGRELSDKEIKDYS